MFGQGCEAPVGLQLFTLKQYTFFVLGEAPPYDLDEKPEGDGGLGWVMGGDEGG